MAQITKKEANKVTDKVWTGISIDIADDPKMFDANYKMAQSLQREHKKDENYKLTRGNDVVITCGEESKSFNSLKAFKKFMGFKETK